MDVWVGHVSVSAIACLQQPTSGVSCPSPQPGVEFGKTLLLAGCPMRKKIVVVLIAFISLCTIGADTAPSFSLSVRLDSRYNRDLTVCTTVRPGEPFNVTWSHGNVRSSITGVLREPAGQRYPLMLTVDQHLTDSKTGNSTTQGYKLELGSWKNTTDVISSAFNDIEERGVLLEKGECPNSTNESSK